NALRETDAAASGDGCIAVHDAGTSGGGRAPAPHAGRLATSRGGACGNGADSPAGVLALRSTDALPGHAAGQLVGAFRTTAGRGFPLSLSGLPLGMSAATHRGVAREPAIADPLLQRKCHPHAI